jgi:hypothetical protein
MVIGSVEVARELSPHEQEEKSRREVESSGHQHSGNWDSRGHVDWDIPSPKTMKEIVAVHLWECVVAIERHQGKT